MNKTKKIQLSTRVNENVAMFLRIQAAKERTTQADIITRALEKVYKDLNIN